MIVITGDSQKLDGFVFVSKASKAEEALEDLLTSFNGDVDPEKHWKLLTDCEKATYLVAPCEMSGVEMYEHYDFESPRWEGFRLFYDEVDSRGFAPNASHW